jgi:hypothetical protein
MPFLYSFLEAGLGRPAARSLYTGALLAGLGSPWACRFIAGVLCAWSRSFTHRGVAGKGGVKYFSCEINKCAARI